MSEFHLSRLVVILLFIVPADLPGQISGQLIQPSNHEITELRTAALSGSAFPVNETFQKKGSVKGRLTELNTKSPICFADISTIDNTLVTKSNSRGEFLLFPNEFPATLRINKFGFKEEKVVLNNPDDSISISLTPLEIHKKKLNKKTLQEYGTVLKTALKKFQKYEGSESPDPVQRKLVYYRITSSVD